MASIFKFKEFEVNQADCAMKINTDGVLLGAMSESASPRVILDVGSGTGVVAMMLAQRFPSSYIDAVDIDHLAFLRSEQNFKESPFSSRLKAYFGDFEMMNPGGHYDLIVSNPPFYVNSLHSTDIRKKIARHADLYFFERLIAFSKNKLAKEGTLQLILPADLADEVKRLAEKNELSSMKEIRIRSFENSEVIRKIVCFKNGMTLQSDNEEFVIYQEKGVYSNAYRTVLKPFFLAF